MYTWDAFLADSCCNERKISDKINIRIDIGTISLWDSVCSVQVQNKYFNKIYKNVFLNVYLVTYVCICELFPFDIIINKSQNIKL